MSPAIASATIDFQPICRDGFEIQRPRGCDFAPSRGSPLDLNVGMCSNNLLRPFSRNASALANRTGRGTTGRLEWKNSVLRELYQQMKAKPVQCDLTGLWNKLGVEPFGEVSFNDRAQRDVQSPPHLLERHRAAHDGQLCQPAQPRSCSSQTPA